ncbi:ABC transporter ATP-binding protein [Salipiger sp. PrR007]|uniref:ABC transporter ATP-binding protein n=1 Tax=Salipiger sp. PrR007 TaxID=2706884 RepID=UPI0013BAA798|nr:ABC transporter ATP-binding protein [Salipiger sp. PrR007]NDW33067.1 ABC transporter ATP-binding protein [Salipiger sp. PrR007]
MLDINGLSSGYGRVPVLRDLHLEIGAAECVGFLGRNGMGKTTLLRAIMGELPAWQGRIAKSGADITKAPTRMRARAGIGYVPQGKQLFKALSVRENLRMGCVKDFGTATAQIEKVLQLFPRLVRLLDRQAGMLSGGEQQLLALARCLCGRPDLILLDEPTEGIQPSICDEIIDVLIELRRNRGLSIILVEQDIDFLWQICDRVLAIDKGSIVRTIDPKAPGSTEDAKTFIGIEG